MKKLFLFFILFLTACGLSVEPLYFDRNGNGIYQATCNGGLRSLGDCYKLAGQQCAGEFEIINQDQHSTGTIGSFNGNSQSSLQNPFSVYNSLNTSMSGSIDTTNIIKRNLIFKCKPL